MLTYQGDINEPISAVIACKTVTRVVAVNAGLGLGSCPTVPSATVITCPNLKSG
jgi:hypothetical protein